MDLLDMQGKHVVIMGVANSRSLAWGIAQTLHQTGAKLIFTYRQERSKKNIDALIEATMPEQNRVVHCDVTSDASVSQAFETIAQRYGSVWGVVHSIAHAKKEELGGRFTDTSREGFQLAHDISSYSLVAVAQKAKPLLEKGGSIVALTYLGGERVVPNYNVMGIAKASLEASVRYLAYDLGAQGVRVNALSAGPIRTLAAKGVSGFGSILKEMETRSPLQTNVTKEDVGKTALYLLSGLSAGVTGETIHVDGGYHIMG